jgi:hypothetical protein
MRVHSLLALVYAAFAAHDREGSVEWIEPLPYHRDSNAGEASFDLSLQVFIAPGVKWTEFPFPQCDLVIVNATRMNGDALVYGAINGLEPDHLVSPGLFDFRGDRFERTANEQGVVNFKLLILPSLLAELRLSLKAVCTTYALHNLEAGDVYTPEVIYTTITVGTAPTSQPTFAPTPGFCVIDCHLKDEWLMLTPFCEEDPCLWDPTMPGDVCADSRANCFDVNNGCCMANWPRYCAVVAAALACCGFVYMIQQLCRMWLNSQHMTFESCCHASCTGFIIFICAFISSPLTYIRAFCKAISRPPSDIAHWKEGWNIHMQKAAEYSVRITGGAHKGRTGKMILPDGAKSLGPSELDEKRRYAVKLHGVRYSDDADSGFDADMIEGKNIFMTVAGTPEIVFNYYQPGSFCCPRLTPSGVNGVEAELNRNKWRGVVKVTAGESHLADLSLRVHTDYPLGPSLKRFAPVMLRGVRGTRDSSLYRVLHIHTETCFEVETDTLVTIPKKEDKKEVFLDGGASIAALNQMDSNQEDAELEYREVRIQGNAAFLVQGNRDFLTVLYRQLRNTMVGTPWSEEHAMHVGGGGGVFSAGDGQEEDDDSGLFAGREGTTFQVKATGYYRSNGKPLLAPGQKRIKRKNRSTDSDDDYSDDYSSTESESSDDEDFGAKRPSICVSPVGVVLWIWDSVYSAIRERCMRVLEYRWTFGCLALILPWCFRGVSYSVLPAADIAHVKGDIELMKRAGNRRDHVLRRYASGQYHSALRTLRLLRSVGAINWRERASLDLFDGVMFWVTGQQAALQAKEDTEKQVVLKELKEEAFAKAASPGQVEKRKLSFASGGKKLSISDGVVQQKATNNIMEMTKEEVSQMTAEEKMVQYNAQLKKVGRRRSSIAMGKELGRRAELAALSNKMEAQEVEAQNRAEAEQRKEDEKFEAQGHQNARIKAGAKAADGAAPGAAAAKVLGAGKGRRQSNVQIDLSDFGLAAETKEGGQKEEEEELQDETTETSADALIPCVFPRIPGKPRTKALLGTAACGQKEQMAKAHRLQSALQDNEKAKKKAARKGKAGVSHVSEITKRHEIEVEQRSHSYEFNTVFDEALAGSALPIPPLAARLMRRMPGGSSVSAEMMIDWVCTAPSPTDIVQAIMNHGLGHSHKHHGKAPVAPVNQFTGGVGQRWSQWGLVSDSSNCYLSLQQLAVALAQAQGKQTYEHNHYARRLSSMSGGHAAAMAAAAAAANGGKVKGIAGMFKKRWGTKKAKVVPGGEDDEYDADGSDEESEEESEEESDLSRKERRKRAKAKAKAGGRGDGDADDEDEEGGKKKKKKKKKKNIGDAGVRPDSREGGGGAKGKKKKTASIDPVDDEAHEEAERMERGGDPYSDSDGGEMASSGDEERRGSKLAMAMEMAKGKNLWGVIMMTVLNCRSMYIKRIARRRARQLKARQAALAKQMTAPPPEGIEAGMWLHQRLLMMLLGYLALAFVVVAVPTLLIVYGNSNLDNTPGTINPLDGADYHTHTPARHLADANGRLLSASLDANGHVIDATAYGAAGDDLILTIPFKVRSWLSRLSLGHFGMGAPLAMYSHNFPRNPYKETYTTTTTTTTTNSTSYFNTTSNTSEITNTTMTTTNTTSHKKTVPVQTNDTTSTVDVEVMIEPFSGLLTLKYGSAALIVVGLAIMNSLMYFYLLLKPFRKNVVDVMQRWEETGAGLELSPNYTYTNDDVNGSPAAALKSIAVAAGQGDDFSILEISKQAELGAGAGTGVNLKLSVSQYSVMVIGLPPSATEQKVREHFDARYNPHFQKVAPPPGAGRQSGPVKVAPEAMQQMKPIAEDGEGEDEDGEDEEMHGRMHGDDDAHVNTGGYEPHVFPDGFGSTLLAPAVTTLCCAPSSFVWPFLGRKRAKRWREYGVADTWERFAQNEKDVVTMYEGKKTVNGAVHHHGAMHALPAIAVTTNHHHHHNAQQEEERKRLEMEQAKKRPTEAADENGRMDEDEEAFDEPRWDADANPGANSVVASSTPTASAITVAWQRKEAEAVRDALTAAAERHALRFGEQHGSWVPEVTVVRRTGYGRSLRLGMEMLVRTEAVLAAQKELVTIQRSAVAHAAAEAGRELRRRQKADIYTQLALAGKFGMRKKREAIRAKRKVARMEKKRENLKRRMQRGEEISASQMAALSGGGGGGGGGLVGALARIIPCLGSPAGGKAKTQKQRQRERDVLGALRALRKAQAAVADIQWKMLLGHYLEGGQRKPFYQHEYPKDGGGDGFTTATGFGGMFAQAGGDGPKKPKAAHAFADEWGLLSQLRAFDEVAIERGIMVSDRWKANADKSSGTSVGSTRQHTPYRSSKRLQQTMQLNKEGVSGGLEEISDNEDEEQMLSKEELAEMKLEAKKDAEVDAEETEKKKGKKLKKEKTEKGKKKKKKKKEKKDAKDTKDGAADEGAARDAAADADAGAAAAADADAAAPDAAADGDATAVANATADSSVTAGDAAPAPDAAVAGETGAPDPDADAAAAPDAADAPNADADPPAAATPTGAVVVSEGGMTPKEAKKAAAAAKKAAAKAAKEQAKAEKQAAKEKAKAGKLAAKAVKSGAKADKDEAKLLQKLGGAPVSPVQSKLVDVGDKQEDSFAKQGLRPVEDVSSELEWAAATEEGSLAGQYQGAKDGHGCSIAFIAFEHPLGREQCLDDYRTSSSTLGRWAQPKSLRFAVQDGNRAGTGGTRSKSRGFFGRPSSSAAAKAAAAGALPKLKLQPIEVREAVEPDDIRWEHLESSDLMRPRLTSPWFLLSVIPGLSLLCYSDANVSGNSGTTWLKYWGRRSIRRTVSFLLFTLPPFVLSCAALLAADTMHRARVTMDPSDEVPVWEAWLTLLLPVIVPLAVHRAFASFEWWQSEVLLFETDELWSHTTTVEALIFRLTTKRLLTLVLPPVLLTLGGSAIGGGENVLLGEEGGTGPHDPLTTHTSSGVGSNSTMMHLLISAFGTSTAWGIGGGIGGAAGSDHNHFEYSPAHGYGHGHGSGYSAYSAASFGRGWYESAGVSTILLLAALSIGLPLAEFSYRGVIKPLLELTPLGMILRTLTCGMIGKTGGGGHHAHHHHHHRHHQGDSQHQHQHHHHKAKAVEATAQAQKHTSAGFCASVNGRGVAANGVWKLIDDLSSTVAIVLACAILSPPLPILIPIALVGVGLRLLEHRFHIAFARMVIERATRKGRAANEAMQKARVVSAFQSQIGQDAGKQGINTDQGAAEKGKRFRCWLLTKLCCCLVKPLRTLLLALSWPVRRLIPKDAKTRADNKAKKEARARSKASVGLPWSYGDSSRLALAMSRVLGYSILPMALLLQLLVAAAAFAPAAHVLPTDPFATISIPMEVSVDYGTGSVHEAEESHRMLSSSFEQVVREIESGRISGAVYNAGRALSGTRYNTNSSVTISTGASTATGGALAGLDVLPLLCVATSVLLLLVLDWFLPTFLAPQGLGAFMYRCLLYMWSFASCCCSNAKSRALSATSVGKRPMRKHEDCAKARLFSGLTQPFEHPLPPFTRAAMLPYSAVAEVDRLDQKAAGFAVLADTPIDSDSGSGSDDDDYRPQSRAAQLALQGGKTAQADSQATSHELSAVEVTEGWQLLRPGDDGRKMFEPVVLNGAWDKETRSYGRPRTGFTAMERMGGESKEERKDREYAAAFEDEGARLRWQAVHGADDGGSESEEEDRVGEGVQGSIMKGASTTWRLRRTRTAVLHPGAGGGAMSTPTAIALPEGVNSLQWVKLDGTIVTSSEARLSTWEVLHSCGRGPPSYRMLHNRSYSLPALAALLPIDEHTVGQALAKIALEKGNPLTYIFSEEMVENVLSVPTKVFGSAVAFVSAFLLFLVSSWAALKEGLGLVKDEDQEELKRMKAEMDKEEKARLAQKKKIAKAKARHTKQARKLAKKNGTNIAADTAVRAGIATASHSNDAVEDALGGNGFVDAMGEDLGVGGTSAAFLLS